jgi:hypothetical protein
VEQLGQYFQTAPDERKDSFYLVFGDGSNESGDALSDTFLWFGDQRSKTTVLNGGPK